MNHIEKEFRSHFNEPVLHGFEIGRVIGYGEDACDCYLIIKKADGSVIWHTAVGGYTFLTPLENQGRIPERYITEENKYWNDLYRLDNCLHINKCQREKEFLVEITTDNPLENLCRKDEEMRKQNDQS